MRGRNNLKLSGLESLEVTLASNFINIGERTNVTGSAKFLKLIKEDKYDDALEVALDQVRGGAQVIEPIGFQNKLEDRSGLGLQAVGDFRLQKSPRRIEAMQCE